MIGRYGDYGGFVDLGIIFQNYYPTSERHIYY